MVDIMKALRIIRSDNEPKYFNRKGLNHPRIKRNNWSNLNLSNLKDFGAENKEIGVISEIEG